MDEYPLSLNARRALFAFVARMVVEEKVCRVCFGDEDDGPLVQPCACRGSAKWIHEHCLEQWRPFLRYYRMLHQLKIFTF